jgi:hypothetical protein
MLAFGVIVHCINNACMIAGYWCHGCWASLAQSQACFAKPGLVSRMRCQFWRRSPSASGFQFAAALPPELGQQQPPTPYAAAPPPGACTPALAFHPAHPGGSPSTAELLRAAHSGSTAAQLSRQLAQAYPRRAVSFAPPACARTCPHAAPVAPSHALY